MQINPDTKQILGLSELLQNKVAQSHTNKASVQAEGIESTFAPYLEKAQELSASAETFDIEQVRNELKSGQYDKPEMIRGAAEKIARFGI